MKVKTLTRSEEQYTRERSSDLFRVHHNPDPSLHPFEKSREYTRALNATKLERVFAKPFVGVLSGHTDGVYALAKHPSILTTVASGSACGEVKIWNLTSRKSVLDISNAHVGFVRGVCFSDNQRLLSCGDDKSIKMFNFNEVIPVATYLSQHPFSSIDHHRRRNVFLTSSSECVELWDTDRSNALQQFTWTANSTHTVSQVKFNPIETSLFASCATDRSIVLYDLRTSTPLLKTVLAMRSNAIAWHPLEAFNFTVANEDYNCYTFDMRKMDTALNVLKDHVSAVLDVDYSPTGHEIVTGSYDRTIRIFPTQQGHSREIYHTRRMQRIFAVKYSMDAKFILSASDEANIRLWKADASEKLGPLAPRERTALNYGQKLKERFEHMPEIKRIARHRHIPKPIYKQSKKHHIMTSAAKKREGNLRKHRQPGSVPFIPERKKPVIAVEK